MARRLLYLTRHGETDWNVAGRWQGHTDVPLNAVGYSQARALGRALRRVSPVAVVSSDLVRAVETARVAAALLRVELAYTDRELRERAFGCFEGLTREECVARHPEAWRAWVEEQRAPEGGEDRKVLAARVTAAIGRAAEELLPGAGPLLVVTHGGSLRAAVTAAYGSMPPPIANGAIWRVEWDGGIVSAEPVDIP
jgi:broad specificity phosphatase PhoE